ncbi:hypothetical protein BT69DRAFT_1351181 [Atractiella rhizophila]|nr:hypothetical protein BT69DRAFT_1351181 [Atractiella rhizophila]
MLVRTGTRGLLRLSARSTRPVVFARAAVPTWSQASFPQQRNISLWPFGSSAPKTAPPPPPAQVEPLAASSPPSPAPEPVLEAAEVTPSPASDAVIPSEPLTEAASNSISTFSSAVQELAAINPDHTLLVSWMQKIFCHLHDFTHLPWLYTIPLFVISYRLLLVPTVATGLRNTIRLQRLNPEMTKYSNAIKDAQLLNDPQLVQTKQRELVFWFKRNDVHPLKSMKAPFMQAAVAIPIFFGLKGLAECTLPSMVTQGAAWFTDLTVYDPTFALPVIGLGTTLVTIWTGTSEFSTGAKPPASQQGVMRFMTFLICASGFWVAYFPAAVTYYFCVNNLYSFFQAMAFRTPAVRRYFDIPKPVPGPKPGEPGYIEPRSLREMVSEMMEDRVRKQAEKQGKKILNREQQNEQEKVDFYRELERQKIERLQGGTRAENVVEDRMKAANERREQWKKGLKTQK